MKSFLTTIERLLDKFTEQEQIENTFKFFIWLSAISVLNKGAVVLITQQKFVPALITTLIIVLLMIQVFSFGVRKIMIPFVEALFPNTNYVKTTKLLEKIPKEQRYLVIRKLLFTWQTLVLVLAYIGFYLVMNQLLEAFIIFNK